MVKSRGLGDDIKKLTDKLGISKLFSDSCGCSERQEKLNSMFPHFKNIRAFTPDEKKVYEKVIGEVVKSPTISPDNQTALGVLYKAVFNAPAKWSSCSPCAKKVLKNLQKIYEKSCDVKSDV
jgi:hypothetical protein